MYGIVCFKCKKIFEIGKYHIPQVSRNQIYKFMEDHSRHILMFESMDAIIEGYEWEDDKDVQIFYDYPIDEFNELDDDL